MQAKHSRVYGQVEHDLLVVLNEVFRLVALRSTLIPRLEESRDFHHGFAIVAIDYNVSFILILPPIIPLRLEISFV